MKQNTTYKQTELGLIPEDWEVKKLGNEINILGGNAFSSNDISEEGIKWLKIANVGINKIKEDVLEFLPFEFKEIHKDFLLKSGDYVMALTRPLLGGKLKISKILNNDEWLLNQRVAKLDSKVGTIEYYINYFKQPYFCYQLEVLMAGTDPPNLSLTEFKNIKIPVPPLPEQKKIADCLSTWDSAIEKQNALINALIDRKKALMQQLLTGKKRLPGFSDEWKEVKLGDLFEKINRKNEEGNTNVVTISAQRGFVKQTDFFNKSVASETLDNYSLIYHGEFCYNKSYSNGYPLGATKRLIAFEKAVVTTLYICFKIKDQKKSNGSFFEQFFEANSLDRSLIKIAQEGGRAHGLLNVSLSDFFNIKIKLPPIEEQTAIAEILAAADRELQLQKEKLAQLQTQKKGLMQVLLTGKKRLIN